MNVKLEEASGSIMQRVREELLARRAQEAGVTGGDAAGGVAGPVFWRPESGRFDERDQYRLDDLLQYEDEEFVENAYRAVLRRAPDDQGLSQFTGQLRAGALTKVEILAALRWSPEGLARSVHVDGLLIPTTLQKWKRKPVVGPLIDWLHTLARLPRLARQQAIQGARSVREARRVGELLNALAGNSVSRASQLERRLAELAVDVASSAADTASRSAVVENILSAEFGQEVFASAASGAGSTDPSAPARPSLLVRLSRAEERLDGLSDDVVAIKAAVERVEQEVARLASAQAARIEGEAARREALAARDRQLDALRMHTDERLRFLESASVQMGNLVNALAVAPVAAAPVESTEEAANEDDALPAVRPPAPSASGMDALYSALEDSFRGSRELVRERVRPYLAEIETASRGMPQDSLVIDIGCGRGEWLELVRDAGYQARGIDMNTMFVQNCRALGLDVVQGDAFDVLRGMPSGSAAAITSIHLIEHLPFETMIALMDECRRVLRPGGLMILETPNPENLMVGAFSFYMDPTHRNPLPPGLMFWLARSRGFAEVRIERLTHARAVEFPALLDEDQPGASSLNRIIEQFRAPLDYAVIARKLA